MTSTSSLPTEMELAPCPLCATKIIREASDNDEWDFRHPGCEANCVLQGLHFGPEHVSSWNTRPEAADKLEALAGRVAMLETTLKRIAKPGVGAGLDWSAEECSDYWFAIVSEDRKLARAALAQTQSEG